MHYKYKHSHFFDDVPRTNFKELSGNICIYGAGFQGLLAAFLLKKQNVDVLCFCDQDVKKQETVYYNLPVYSPKKMKELYPDATVIVTPYSLAPAYQYVKEKLGYNSIVTPYSLFLEFDTDEFDVLPELPEWYQPGSADYHIDLFLRVCINVITDYTIYSADISVTEVCNLRCRDCQSLMPCYKNPKSPSLEDMIYCVDTITKNRTFNHFNIEGGEAFVWKHLPDFLEYLCSLPNLLNVYLYTNGTIIPNKRLLNALKNDKLMVRISNYKNYTKTDELVNLFKQYGINHRVVLQKWYRFTDLLKEEQSEEETKRVVATCCKTQPCGNGGVYFIDGKVFYCPIQANLHNLGIFTSPEKDYVDLMNTNDINLQEKLVDILEKKRYPELCKHRKGRAYCGNEVPPAVQLKKGESIEVKFV